MKNYTFVCQYDNTGERIDKCISELYEELTRTYIQRIIKDNLVLVNGKAVKASYKLVLNDVIEFTTPDAIIPDIVPEDIPIDILYEDDDVIVVNKPKGLVVHPAPGHYNGTLVNGLLYHCKDNLSGINGVMRPGIVHRIDMNTTGSLLICKNDKAHLSIANQLKEHSINRIYTALVHGIIPENEGRIDAPIGRSDKDRKKMAVNYNHGKSAITNFKVIDRFDKYTLIKCKLETGRTHQIRVHMAYINHPIVGDDVYCHQASPRKLQGQTLHAGLIGFISPTTGKYIEVEAPLPEYFEDLLKELKNNH